MGAAIASALRLAGIPGTNKVMMGELSRLARRALGRVPPKPEKAGTGQLLYPADPELAHLAVHYHRTASRVLWDLYTSDARRLEPLYEQLIEATAGDRRRWWQKARTISVNARNVDDFAAGARQIVGTVKNAIIDGVAGHGQMLRVDPAAADLHIMVRMHGDTLSVSIDLGGGTLSKRGYRARAGAAPLRENLAAALVMLARHDARSEILVDPMSGSATIAIEAALMATAAPLWVPPRGPAIRCVPGIGDLPAPGDPLFGDTFPRVVAIELDARTASTARSNARLAGVAETVRFQTGDFREVAIERVAELAGAGLERGLILSNPPFGERLSDDDLYGLYRDLRDWCRQLRGWRAGFLVSNPLFEKAFGRPRVVKPLPNPPLRCYFYLYDL